MDVLLTLLHNLSLYHSQTNWEEHGFQMYGHLPLALRLGLRALRALKMTFYGILTQQGPTGLSSRHITLPPH